MGGCEYTEPPPPTPPQVYHLVAEGEYECGTGLEVTGADVTV